MFVFLLDRPGCSKSVVFKKIKEYLSEKIDIDEITRIDDFPKLWMIFQEKKQNGGKDVEKQKTTNIKLQMILYGMRY